MRKFTPVPKPEPKPKSKPNRIKPRSNKRAKQEREYSRLRLEFLEANPYCEGKLIGCTHIATEVQHSLGRQGKLLTDVSKFKASCHNCNMRAETHPHEARLNGFSKSRLHD